MVFLYSDSHLDNRIAITRRAASNRQYPSNSVVRASDGVRVTTYVPRETSTEEATEMAQFVQGEAADFYTRLNGEWFTNILLPSADADTLRRMVSERPSSYHGMRQTFAPVVRDEADATAVANGLVPIFGVELEVEGVEDAILRTLARSPYRHWLRCEYDSTVSGLEIISQPISGTVMTEAVDAICEVAAQLFAAGCRTSSRTGLHVHIGNISRNTLSNLAYWSADRNNGLNNGEIWTLTGRGHNLTWCSPSSHSHITPSGAMALSELEALPDGRTYRTKSHLPARRLKDRYGTSHSYGFIILSDDLDGDVNNRANHAELRIWRASLNVTMLRSRLLLTKTIVGLAKRGRVQREDVLGSRYAKSILSEVQRRSETQ